MKAHSNYYDAHAEALKAAKQTGREVGIERTNEFGRTVYSVKHLPDPGNRYGWELRCEIVRPTD